MDDNNKFVSNAIYGYLFENLALLDIELKYIGVNVRGFYAKTVLNGVGLDTSRKGNRGLYQGENLNDVINLFLSDQDPILNNIGRLLKEL